MASEILDIRHLFGGGWATDFGPTVDITPDNDAIVLPFLVDAQNVFFELDGGPHKIGGTSAINSSAIGSGSPVTGVYDFWRNSGGTSQRRRIAHAGTIVAADNDDGSFSNIFTGMADGAIPSYSTFDDLLIIGSSASADVPRSYDGTTAQNLAGSPPNFAFSVTHYGHQFAAGDATNPSTLSYSVPFDPEDWSGAGSGTIQIDPNDGDTITGLASYKGELWVFKGPYKGSIHRVTGTSSSDFAVKPFIKEGLGAAWHNSIFQYGDDLGFMSQYGTVHSLHATSAFGDFTKQAMSRPIHKWLREHLNFNRLKNIWAVNDPDRGQVIFTLSIDASSTNNVCIMMDYSFNPVRWAYWPVYKGGSLGRFVGANGTREIVLGGNDGKLYSTQSSARSIAGLDAIPALVTLPYLNYGSTLLMKTLYRTGVGIAPKGNYNATLAWARDDNTQQTVTVNQGGGDLLGPSAVDPFTLGTSVLAGAQYVDRYTDHTEGGEFRSIQFQISQSGLNEDFEMHSLTAGIQGGAISTEN